MIILAIVLCVLTLLCLLWCFITPSLPDCALAATLCFVFGLGSVVCLGYLEEEPKPESPQKYESIEIDGVRFLLVPPSEQEEIEP